MKILIIAAASFAPFFLSNQPGDVIDMPEEISKDLIAAGLAEEVKKEDEKAPEEPTKTAEPSELKEAEAPKEIAPEEPNKKTTKK